MYLLNSCFIAWCQCYSSGSPSRIRIVRRISFGMTIRPRSSIRLTIPVAFIYIKSPCIYRFVMLVSAKQGDLYLTYGLICDIMAIIKFQQRRLKGMSHINDFVIKEGVLAKYSGKGGTVVIPDGVTSIGNMAFYCCSGLASITIPNSVTSIHDHAFDGCSSLTGITIPESVTRIGNNAFYFCTSLTSVIISGGVKSIGDDAFSRCSDLESIIIPDSVTSIGDFAFYECSDLTNITLPSSIISIGDNTFDDCTSLTSIDIPEGVVNIGAWAFCGCKRLTNVTIPDSVTSIGLEAFEGCKKLTIYAHKGSYAEEYAEENDISFKAID